MQLHELAQGSIFVQLELETKYDGRMRFQIQKIEFDRDMINVTVGRQARHHPDNRVEPWFVLPEVTGVYAQVLQIEVTKHKKPWTGGGKIIFATTTEERGTLFPAGHSDLIQFSNTIS